MQDRGHNDKKKEEREKAPAPWKPINLEKFNKSTGVVSEIFRADPDRMNEAQEDNLEKEE